MDEVSGRRGFGAVVWFPLFRLLFFGSGSLAWGRAGGQWVSWVAISGSVPC